MSPPKGDRLDRGELHCAAVDKDLAAMKRLLAAGADPNAKDKQGWTPLQFACQSNCAAAAQLLLDAGASVDSRDSYGNTPLFKAVFNSRGDGDTIAVLRRAGADPHAANLSGITPLQLARSTANFDIRRFFADLPEADPTA